MPVDIDKTVLTLVAEPTSSQIITDVTSDKIVIHETPVSVVTDVSPTQVITSNEKAQVASATEQGPPGRDGKDGAPGRDGAQGPPGADGAIGLPGIDGKDGKDGATGSQGAPGLNGVTDVVWILDVTPTYSGIVAQKTFKPYVATNPLINYAVTDTLFVRVKIGTEGTNLDYSPVVDVNGVQASLTESTTTRWFTGYADIVLVNGLNTITATSGGDTDVITILASIGGPVINSITFGNYPGTQTSLKQGDVVPITIYTDSTAVSVTINLAGASGSSKTLLVINGVATGTILISSASGNQTVTAIAKNGLGTNGDAFTSSYLLLDQVKPSLSLNSIINSSGYLAAKVGESVDVKITAQNFDTILYNSSQMTIPDDNVYNQVKTALITFSGYSVSNNYTVTAHKNSNDSSTTLNVAVKIASSQPTATISISGNPSRLLSSPSGSLYTVIITPTQLLANAPSMTASIGTWQGTWVSVGSNWQRVLSIKDTDDKGSGLFSNLILLNEANVSGSIIISGSTYVVGGFTNRTLTFPAFSRVVAIGTTVSDQTKTSSQIIGGNTLTRYSDSLIRANGFYIANADGSYNPTGTYLGLSDSVFAGSNTSGTLQASLQEVS